MHPAGYLSDEAKEATSEDMRQGGREGSVGRGRSNDLQGQGRQHGCW